MGTAGDVNGDGLSDIIIGSTRYDAAQVDAGRAWVYLGEARTSVPSPRPTSWRSIDASSRRVGRLRIVTVAGGGSRTDHRPTERTDRRLERQVEG